MSYSYYKDFLGIRVVEDDANEPLCVIDPGMTTLGRTGIMHGGAVASLLEMAAIVAVEGVVLSRNMGGEPSLRWQHVSSTVDYIRPGLAKLSYAKAKFEKLAKRSATLSVLAWNEDATKPVAMAKMTFIFL